MILSELIMYNYVMHYCVESVIIIAATALFAGETNGACLDCNYNAANPGKECGCKNVSKVGNLKKKMLQQMYH